MKYLLIALVLAAGCGKQDCTYVLGAERTGIFGTLEKIQCHSDEVVKSVTPKYLPGGEVVTHLEVQCAKVDVVCK